MKRKMLIAFAGAAAPLMATLAPGGRAHAQGGPGPAKALAAALYRPHIARWADLGHFDVDREYADHDPGFTETGTDGKVETLEQAKARTQRNLPTLRSARLNVQVQQARLTGQTLTVLYSQRYEVKAVIPNHGLVPVSEVGVYQDTWRRAGNGWRLVATRDLQDTVSYPHPGAGGGSGDDQRYWQRKIYEQQIQQQNDMEHMLNCAQGYGYQCGGY